MMHYSIAAFDLTPFSILKVYFERLKANGIKRVQLMDPVNDLNFRVHHSVTFAREVGLEVALGLVFSISPKHTASTMNRKFRLRLRYRSTPFM